MEFLRILLTNDDGVYASGIRAVRDALVRLPGVELTIVAPDRERSASGHAITVHRPIHVDEVTSLGPECPAWRVTGTPADCVKLAVEALLPQRPEIVVSGINRGANLGTDVFYSGTVSAAIEATFYDIPSLAVSLDAWNDADFQTAAAYIAWAVPRLHGHKLPPRTLLNVNVPGVPPEQLAGVALTKLGVRRYRNVFDRRTDPRGRSYYWLAGELVDANNDPDTDVMAVRSRRISVTPIQLDLTDHRLFTAMDAWGLDAWPGVRR